VQSLTATLALLCSPPFTAGIGGGEASRLEQGLVEAAITGETPVVSLRRVHRVCGRALQRASFRLDDFFADGPFGEEPADEGEQPAKRQCTGEPDGRLTFPTPATVHPSNQQFHAALTATPTATW